MNELPIPAVLAVDAEPFSDDELDSALADVLILATGISTAAPAKIVDHPASKWVIDGERSAEWCARKFASEMAVVADVKSRADEWRERINDWEQAETKRARGRAAFFEERLTSYMAVLRRESEYVNKKGETDWRVKSVSLPSATLKSSKQSARVKLGQSEGAEAQAVAWCEANGIAAAVKKSLLVSGLKGVVDVKDGQLVPATKDGEVVPGLVVEPESVSYSVKLP